MAGGKRKGHGQRGKNQPIQGPRRTHKRTHRDKDARWMDEPEPQILTLAEVARNTEHHRDGSHHRRKQNPTLVFVAGGFLYNERELSLPAKVLHGADALKPAEQDDNNQSRQMSNSDKTQTSTDQEQAGSESDGDSGEDEVLFSGRHRMPPRRQQKTASQVEGRKYSRQSPGHNYTTAQPQKPGRVAAGSTAKFEDQAPNRTHRQLRMSKTKAQESQPYPPSDNPMKGQSQLFRYEEALDDYITNIADQISEEDSCPSEQSLGSANRTGRSLDRSLRQSWQMRAEAVPSREGSDDAITFFQTIDSPASPLEFDSVSFRSADTVEQATHDLQVALDNLGDAVELSPDKADPVPSTSLATHPKRHLRGASIISRVSSPHMNEESASEDGKATRHGTQHRQIHSGRVISQRSSRELTNESMVGYAIERAEWPEFDLTDFSPETWKSARWTSSSKLIRPEFGLSDSELEKTLIASWEADKVKKKLRKKLREQARANGGMATNSITLSGGVGNTELDWDTVTRSMFELLISENESLSLPPMDKRSRKLMHEFATAFKLKSKSTGSGDHRFPTVHRTPRTIRPTDAQFAEVVARLSRRFRSRASGNTIPELSGLAGPGRTRASIASASYRDGDIVGAKAPEIGVENRGRAMLEKMGWSSGTALGAMNNKGILQPVSHTVKNSRLGLG